MEELQSWRRQRRWLPILTNCSRSEQGGLNSLCAPLSPTKTRIKHRARIRLACFLLLAVIKVHMICAFRTSSVMLTNCGSRNKMHTPASRYTSIPISRQQHVAGDTFSPTNLKVQATSWLTIDSSLGSVERTTRPASTSNRSSNNPDKTRSKSNSTAGGGKRRKYNRKLPLSPSEKALLLSRRKRNATYEKMRLTSLKKHQAPPSIWSFDSLFPDPVLDEKSVREDLYG